MKIPAQARMQLAERVQRATSAAERTAMYREYCALYGVDESTARRHAGHRTRPHAPAAFEPDPVLDQVATLWLGSKTEKYETATMPLWRAIEIAETSKLIEPGSVSEGRLRRYLRQLNVSLNDQRRGTPHVYLKSEHPNHVHQFDVSVCRQWYLRSDGRVYVQSYQDGTAAYHNKEIRGGTKLYRYVLVDHTSDAFYVQYTTDAETAATMLTFLAAAWMPKKQRFGIGPTGVERWWPAPFDPSDYATWSQLSARRDYPFRGAPRILVVDRASANQSQFVERVCERLGIELIPAQKARAKGAVERKMWQWETVFEAGLAFQSAPDLDTLNVWALDYLERFNLTREQTRHGMTRMQCWQTIAPEQLREMVDWPTFQELATRDPVPRTVKSGDLGGFVSYRARLWRVPDPELYGQKVHVWHSAFTPDEVCLRTADGRVLLLAEAKTDRYGFHEHAATIGQDYRRHPETATETSTKRLDAVRAALPPLEVFGREADKRDTPALLPREGVQITVNVDHGAREISRTQFNRRVTAELGRAFTEAEGAERDRRWAGHTTLPESAVGEFVEWCHAAASPTNVRRLFG